MRYLFIEYQKSVTMCIVKSMFDFIRRGTSTFSLAAQGRYESRSERIVTICKELAETVNGPAVDKARLRRDRLRISQDVSNAFLKYTKDKE